MTFFETLKANCGELIKLKNQLFWYKKGGWDGTYNRICLIVDVINAMDDAGRDIDLPDNVVVQAYSGRPGGRHDIFEVALCLIIDELPKWIWVDKRHVELLLEDNSSVEKIN
jgi:hypothetical protein